MARTELSDKIETERLVLRVRTVADAEDIHAYASLPEVAYPAGFPPVKTLEDGFIIWSTFFRSVIKRKISQQATGLSSKERIRSLALSISTIAMGTMC